MIILCLQQIKMIFENKTRALRKVWVVTDWRLFLKHKFWIIECYCALFLCDVLVTLLIKQLINLKRCQEFIIFITYQQREARPGFVQVCVYVCMCALVIWAGYRTIPRAGNEHTHTHIWHTKVRRKSISGSNIVINDARSTRERHEYTQLRTHNLFKALMGSEKQERKGI